MADAAEAAAAAAAAVTTEIAAVEANAEAAIAAAAAATEQAEELAEDLAEAAMESERGQRIASLETRFDTWQREQSEKLSGIESELQSLRQTMTAPAAAPVTVVTTEEPTAVSSILPASPEEPAAVIIPGSVDGESTPSAPEQQAAVRKRRFL
jgi:hypothetical protein